MIKIKTMPEKACPSGSDDPEPLVDVSTKCSSFVLVVTTAAGAAVVYFGGADEVLEDQAPGLPQGASLPCDGHGSIIDLADIYVHASAADCVVRGLYFTPGTRDT